MRAREYPLEEAHRAREGIEWDLARGRGQESGSLGEKQSGRNADGYQETGRRGGREKPTPRGFLGESPFPGVTLSVQVRRSQGHAHPCASGLTVIPVLQPQLDSQSQMEQLF